MKLLNFTQFINEARLSEHGNKRLDQRVKDSMVISFPTEAKKLIREIGKTSTEVAVKAVELMKEEFLTRFETKLMANDFSDVHRVAILFEPVLKIGGKRFPINMTVSSVDEKNPDVIKTYSGEKLCVYVSNNTITTIKVLPDSYSEIDVLADFEDHLVRKGRRNTKPKLIQVESEYTLELTETGEVRPLEKEKSSSVGVVNKIEKDFTLTPGRKIKFQSLATNSLVEAEIIEVINKSTYKEDKVFRLSIRKADGSTSMKSLKPGDTIYLPIGSDGGWVNAKIADQLYTIDNRVSSPILRVVI